MVSWHEQFCCDRFDLSLHFGGRLLKDNRTLGHEVVCNHSTVEARLTMLGGMRQQCISQGGGRRQRAELHCQNQSGILSHWDVFIFCSNRSLDLQDPVKKGSEEVDGCVVGVGSSHPRTHSRHGGWKAHRRGDVRWDGALSHGLALRYKNVGGGEHQSRDVHSISGLSFATGTSRGSSSTCWLLRKISSAAPRFQYLAHTCVAHGLQSPGGVGRSSCRISEGGCETFHASQRH